MNPVQAAIADWQAKRITGTALMRALVSFDAWSLPVSEATAINLFNDPTNLGARLSRGTDGLTRLMLYSDARFVSSTAARNVIAIKGEWVFDLNLAGVDEIAIDAGQPHEIRYKQPQFARLGQIAREVAAERKASLAGN